MRLINNTRFSTRDLRRFCLAGLKEMGAGNDRLIIFYYSKGTADKDTYFIKGLADLGRKKPGYCIELWIPEWSWLDVPCLARVFEHEVAHTLGVDHNDMDRDVFYCRQPVPWCRGLRVRYMKQKKAA